MFTAEEQLIALTEPTDALLRKVAALNVLEPKARIAIDGVEHSIRHVVPAPGASGGAAGEVLEKHENGWTVRTGDGMVRLFSS
jgi:methionyl-tRNA formyltransferase